MKVYPDANIYIAYLLAEKDEPLIDTFFRQGASCRFTIVASKTMFAEIAQICQGKSILLLQKHIDDFKEAGKLEIVDKTSEDVEKAIELDIKSGKKCGLNDFLHAILAKKYADVLVTNDAKLIPHASKIVRTMKMKDFLISEP